ncbi:hypothetical protein EDD21DRAFT_386920 [Dissophora ornata]|nr:hypothetical protein BGZ58_010709 [Dissophora ornata]KAI8596907.1 hypothetical protein EDD21DRAFT_386920 [Dissophora ornata]
MPRERKSTLCTPSISDHVTLHLTIQTQIDALQNERKMIKDQFFVTPNMHRSYASVEEPFFLSYNKDFLLQQLWYHAGYSVQMFRSLLLKEEGLRAQKVYDLCQALVNLTPVAVQQMHSPIPRKTEVLGQEKGARQVNMPPPSHPNLQLAKGEQSQKAASTRTKVRQDEMTIAEKQGNVGSAESEAKPDTNNVAKITHRELQRLRQDRTIDSVVWHSSLESEARLGSAIELRPGEFTTSEAFLQITKDNEALLVGERNSSSCASDGESGYCDSYNSMEENTTSTGAVVRVKERRNQGDALGVMGQDEKAIYDHGDVIYEQPHWHASDRQPGSTARGATNHDFKQIVPEAGRQSRLISNELTVMTIPDPIIFIIFLMMGCGACMVLYGAYGFLANKLF